MGETIFVQISPYLNRRSGTWLEPIIWLESKVMSLNRNLKYRQQNFALIQMYTYNVRVRVRRRMFQLPLKRFPDSSVSSLIPTGRMRGRRASHHQKLAPTFPGIDSCLVVTKRDFLEMEAYIMTKRAGLKMLLKVDCLPNACWEAAVRYPRLILGREWTLSWWWWWWLMCDRVPPCLNI